MRPDRTSVTVSSVPDYAPSDAERRQNAMRLCRDAIKQACRDSVLAEQLEQLDGVPTTTLSQEIYKVSLLQLAEIGSNANDPDGKPNYPARLKAHEILSNMRMREAELIIEMRKLGLGAPDEPQKPASGHENVLTRDEAVEILQARRRRQAVGA